MREYVQRKQASGNQIQSSASRQASAAEVLQNYKKKIVQMQTMNEEELLQGKFDATQREEIASNEKVNNTGLPDNLKSGIENLSGYSMDDVRVHYNSDKPAQLQALAYAQGTDIHIAPGQEQHLPHEAWHVVQQKQGRVQPTTQLQGINVNDNEGLEKEADVMGGEAIQFKFNSNTIQRNIKFKEIRKHQDMIVGSWKDKSEEGYAERVKSFENKLNIIELDNTLTLNSTVEDVKEKKLNDLEKLSQDITLCKIIYGKDPIECKSDVEFLTISAVEHMDIKGGAAYNYIHNLVIYSPKTSLRDILHEIGHSFQNIVLRANSETVNPILLEYHNIIFHENLFDQANFRLGYMVKNEVYNDVEWKGIKNGLKDKNLEIFNKIDQELHDNQLYINSADEIRGNLIKEYKKSLSQP